ncbi:MAG: acetate--CoA ligase [Chitinophagales bacterium]|nr:acetate--CoA ligase [Bacteroidota bacterium]MCB9043314.1 acetate--CoA ligase [Chitinophagales bacterium]
MKFIAKTQEDYQKLYNASVQNPQDFWAEFAETNFIWQRKWDKVLDYNFEKAHFRWFEGAKLNITQNCIDRHLPEKAAQTALIFEPNDPNEEAQHISYATLAENVNKTANLLKNLGVQKGDRVCIYLPMIPELAYSVLACARIGAVHSVVFAGFSAQSLADRINDASCKVLITADGGFRGNKTTPLFDIATQALQQCTSIEHLLMVKRCNNVSENDWHKHQQVLPAIKFSFWEKMFAAASAHCPPVWVDAEDPLFILYTSGSTGKPKGMVHTSGGYMVYTNFTFCNVFQYQAGDVYWCTADIGWITGHSYILYGPLSAGATTLMFEGVPSYPDMGRFWQVIEKHKVNIFYTAPTAIRALEQADISFVEKYDLRSLKTLGTVGEPINVEAWEWYNKYIGKNNCPIVDTWWQTETGGIMISNLAGVTPQIPTFATLPLPGVQACLLDENGKEISHLPAEGKLCIKYPWPSMARTIYGNHQRFVDTYFSAFKGYYFTGDGCRCDVQGNFRITGRVDDIVIVSGHNLGTAEIENAINQHPNIIESAVVGFPHAIKGNAIYAFVSCLHKPENEALLQKEIAASVSELIGPIAKPDKIQVCYALPKTRSGKIMRRILRKIAAGEFDSFGDISTLLNPECVAEIIKGAK